MKECLYVAIVGDVASGAAELRSSEDHGGVLDNTGRARSTCEAGLEPPFGMPTNGRHGEARLRLLVSSGTYDKLRRGARRLRQAHAERLHSDGVQNEAYARRQLHVRTEQR